MIEIDGHIVFVAKSKAAALGILSAIGVDIVITSCALEGATDGLLLATKAKMIQPNLAVLLVSDMQESSPSKNAPVDGYIQKPFDHSRLASAIKSLSEIIFSRRRKDR
jgi:two-component SAPR family response regulator